VGRVVVIGGGPGGSTAGTMLARQGHDVVLFERERFPRQHIGESLLPASIPILDLLGVRAAVEQAGFVKKWGATMIWGAAQEPWSWYFRETNPRYPHSYQVWRPLFDQLLLDNSRRNGVDVREGHRVTEVLFDSGRVAGVRYDGGAGVTGIEEADFVVDASGQAAIIGRALDLRRWDPFFRNMAVYAYFSGARRLPSPDETNILVESYANGWFWTIPLHNGLTSVGAVVDRGTADARVRGRSLDRFLLDELAATDATAGLLRDAALSEGPYSIKDWSYTSDTVVGDGFILVGDAACFVDPLFSSGVHLALSAGVLAAAYVTSALKNPEMAVAAAPVYQELYYSHYNRFHEMAKLFYSSNRTVDSYFWEARRILGDRDHDHEYSPRQDFIRAVAGQPPQGYERVVLAQGDLPPGFVKSIKEAEDNLTSRQKRLIDGAGRLGASIPRLASDATIVHKPVLGDGEFVWGDVLISTTRPEGVACSPLVVDLLRGIDGIATTESIIERVARCYPPETIDQIKGNLIFAVQTLFVEGAIEELSGL
jgi:FAD-dependent halogenase